MHDARLVILGGRGSIPVSGSEFVRYGGSTTSFAIVAGGHAVAFIDAGTGMYSLHRRGIPLAPAFDVFLTHYHLDHIQGLSMLDELWRRSCDVTVWGPGDPSAVLEKAISPPLFPVSIADDAVIRFATVASEVAVDDCRVASFPVHHPQGAVGYRIDGPNRSVAVVTDHEAGSPLDASVAEAIEGVDVLIHDAQYLPEEVQSHHGWGHSTYVDAIALAEAIGAGELLLTSHDPGRTDDQVDAVVEEARARFPATGAVFEGMEVPL
jgi:ribonuclease BN (tRNA processing enzyme)